MTLTLEIPEELAARLGPEATRLSREALGLSRLALDGFLKDNHVYLEYTMDDLEQDRASLLQFDPA